MNNNDAHRLRPPNEVLVPTEIKTAASLGKLAFFVGNGISRLYGAPSWDELCSQMLKALAEAKIIDYNMVDILRRQSWKAQISIADHLFKKHRELKPEDFCYKKYLYNDTIKSNRKKISAYDSLAKCGIKFITTNYDTLLFDAMEGLSKATVAVKNTVVNSVADQVDHVDKAGAKTVNFFPNPYEFKKNDSLDNNVLFHIHGSISAEETIIASTMSYLNLYNDLNVISFLEWFFDENVVVFIGYGLDELELLDLVVRKSNKTTGLNKKHFLLLPLLTHEAKILDQLEIYYGQLGIKLLPFSRDQRDYSAYSDLLEVWSGELAQSAQEPTRVDSLKLLDRLIVEFERGNR